MTTWRTDFDNVPKGDNQTFDVAMINANGDRWRETDCIVNGSRQICSYDRDFGYEPLEHHFSDKEFRRATHWMVVDLPANEDKGRPG